MVDLDVGELGDGGRLEQTGIIQPGAVEGEKVQLAALQGGQAAAVDGGVAVQQKIAQFGHSGENRETGVGEGAVLHAEIDHAFVTSKGGKQFIGHRTAFYMKANQGVPGQPLHDLCGQLRGLKFLFPIQGQDAVFPVRRPRPFWPFHYCFPPYACSL